MTARYRLRSINVLVAIIAGMLLAIMLLPFSTPVSAQAEAASDKKARLRAVHAVPDFGAVDVYVNHKRVLSNVNFFTVSDYLSLDPGHYRVQVIPAGDQIGHPRLFVVNTGVRVAAGKDYSLVARGNAAQKNVGGTLLTDDNSAPPAGKARLRAAHFSPDAPGVDIFVNGAKAITNLTFRNASDYLAVDPGTYTIGIAPTGGEVIFTTEATVAAGQVVTAWANGLLGETSGPKAFKVTPTVDAEFKSARVRAVHAVPDLVGSPVDVFANGEKIATFDFFTATEYLTVPAGEYDLRVVPAGGDPKTDAAIQAKVNLEGDKDYSAVARGTGGDFGATLLTDDNSAPPAGKARLRAAHFSPDAPGVDIFVNGAKAITNLTFRNASDYLAVDPGTYTIGIAPTGGEVIFTTEATVAAGQVVTAWANGLLGETSGPKAFKVTPTVDAEFKSARVRAVHAVPDLAGSPVDVFANGEKIATFDFFTVTDYLTVPPGTYDIRVVPAGRSLQADALIQATATFEGGKDYSVIASGTGGNFSATVLTDDNSAPPAGKSRLRAAHFSPNAPGVDIFVNGNKVITNLTFRNASDYLPVEPGAYKIGIAPTGGEVIFTTDVTVQAGQVATAWANGLLNESGAKAFKVTTRRDVGTQQANTMVMLPLVIGGRG